MSDNTFDSEKSWSNVSSSRSKPRRWESSSGVDQEKAEAAQEGVLKSANEGLGGVVAGLLGYGKKKKEE